MLPLTVGGGFQAAAWGGDPELNQAVLLRWRIWKGGLGGPQQNVWSAGEESIPETEPHVSAEGLSSPRGSADLFTREVKFHEAGTDSPESSKLSGSQSSHRR